MIISNKCAGPATSQKIAWRKYEMRNVFANIVSETGSHPRHSEEQVCSMLNETGAICLDRREQMFQTPSPCRATSQIQALHIEDRSVPREVLCETVEITIDRESSPNTEAQLTKQIVLNKSVDSIPSAKAVEVPSDVKVVHLPSDVKVVHLPSSKGTNGDTRVAGGYASCKVSQLMHECAERGIEVKRGSRKATIVRMLQDEDRKK